MGFLQAWRERRGRQGRERGALAFASKLGPCAACGNSAANHDYFMLASVITSRETSDVAEFESLVTQRQWSAVAKFQEWEGLENELVLYAVRCSVAREVTLKKLCDLAELWSDSYLVADVKLDSSEQSQVEALAAGRWQSLAVSAEI